MEVVVAVVVREAQALFEGLLQRQILAVEAGREGGLEGRGRGFECGRRRGAVGVGVGVSDSDTARVMGAAVTVMVMVMVTLAVAVAGAGAGAGAGAALPRAGAAGARVEVELVVADHAGCCWAGAEAGADVIVIVDVVAVGAAGGGPGGDEGPRVPRAGGGVFVVVGRAVAVEAAHAHCDVLKRSSSGLKSGCELASGA